LPFLSLLSTQVQDKIGGVRRFQDSQDKASTANLRQHARKCFGDEAVKQVMAGDSATERSGSIFSAFARQGQQPVRPSNRVTQIPKYAHTLSDGLRRTVAPVRAVEDAAPCALVGWPPTHQSSFSYDLLTRYHCSLQGGPQKLS